MDTLASGFALVLEVFLFAAFLALVVERLIEHLYSPLVEFTGFKFTIRYVALLLGGLGSWAFNIDLFTPLAVSIGLEPLVSWAGLLFSGVLVGGGSNLLHDVWPGN